MQAQYMDGQELVLKSYFETGLERRNHNQQKHNSSLRSYIGAVYQGANKRSQHQVTACSNMKCKVNESVMKTLPLEKFITQHSVLSDQLQGHALDLQQSQHL